MDMWMDVRCCSECDEEVEGVLHGLSTAAPLQAMHTVLRQHGSDVEVQVAGYRALRNLAAIPTPDCKWADRVGAVFIGHLISLLQTMQSTASCQHTFGVMRVAHTLFITCPFPAISPHPKMFARLRFSHFASVFITHCLIR